MAAEQTAGEVASVAAMGAMGATVVLAVMVVTMVGLEVARAEEEMVEVENGCVACEDDVDGAGGGSEASGHGGSADEANGNDLRHRHRHLHDLRHQLLAGDALARADASCQCDASCFASARSLALLQTCGRGAAATTSSSSVTDASSELLHAPTARRGLSRSCADLRFLRSEGDERPQLNAGRRSCCLRAY